MPLLGLSAMIRRDLLVNELNAQSTFKYLMTSASTASLHKDGCPADISGPGVFLYYKLTN